MKHLVLIGISIVFCFSESSALAMCSAVFKSRPAPPLSAYHLTSRQVERIRGAGEHGEALIAEQAKVARFFDEMPTPFFQALLAALLLQDKLAPPTLKELLQAALMIAGIETANEQLKTPAVLGFLEEHLAQFPEPGGIAKPEVRHTTALDHYLARLIDNPQLVKPTAMDLRECLTLKQFETLYRYHKQAIQDAKSSAANPSTQRYDRLIASFHLPHFQLPPDLSWEKMEIANALSPLRETLDMEMRTRPAYFRMQLIYMRDLFASWAPGLSAVSFTERVELVAAFLEMHKITLPVSRSFLARFLVLDYNSLDAPSSELKPFLIRKFQLANQRIAEDFAKQARQAYQKPKRPPLPPSRLLPLATQSTSHHPETKQERLERRRQQQPQDPPNVPVVIDRLIPLEDILSGHIQLASLSSELLYSLQLDSPLLESTQAIQFSPSVIHELQSAQLTGWDGLRWFSLLQRGLTHRMKAGISPIPPHVNEGLTYAVGDRKTSDYQIQGKLDGRVLRLERIVSLK